MKTINKICISLALSSSLVACNSGSSNNNNNVTYPYQFVVDAGSSGSRIYVYNKIQTESGSVLIDLYEKKTSIPLASFANNPSAAGASLQPLFESAIAFITTTESNVNIANIPTSVLGTAGMRLIPAAQQAAIYQNVAATISNDGLQLGQVDTITGQYEGIYSWLDVNYLQNNLSSTTQTNGIFEVGGASAQVAFATSGASDSAVVNVRVNGVSYNVYSTSFLGLGQDVARASMLSAANYNQCYPSGYTDNVLNINGSFNYSGCGNNYSSIISNFPQINTVNQVPNFYNQKFVGVSSVYYALSFWGIESQPSQLATNIQSTCTLSYSQMQSNYPNAFNLQNQCANSVLINNMMFDNLQFESNQLYAVPTINGTSLTYTLGFALLNY